MQSLATRRRRDIQGLRAIAVLVVALNHAGVGFLKGGYVGVDVFFVLSGYLITGVLVSSSETRRNREAFFSTFYAHRARRILPAAVLTLVATDIAAWSLLNIYRAHQVLVDSISATFFVVNFHFASIGTNYFAMGQPPSPLQHFWSLSVEEQFYVVWPLIVALALLGVLLRGRRDSEWTISPTAVRNLGIVATLITVASLAFAIYDTHRSPAAAYFSTPARAWELGLGALLSLSVRRLARFPAVVMAAIGWLGGAAIIAASVLYSASTRFPGAAALLPTLGAAAIIAAGLRPNQPKFALSRVLSLAPLRYVGDRSYTFYLWHWPVLILVMEHAGHSISVGENLMLLVAAFALSVITYRFYENPLRRSPKLRGPIALALWPAAVVTVLFVCSIHLSDYQNAVNAAYSFAAPESLKEEAPATATVSAISGFVPSSPSVLESSVAAVRRSSPIPSQLMPSVLAVPADVYHVPVGCISKPTTTRSTICSLGDTSSQKTLVVFGDSHGQMWVPAITSFASRNGYDVRPILKYSCNPWRWAGPEQVGECATWYKWAVAQVRVLHPALLSPRNCTLTSSPSRVKSKSIARTRYEIFRHLGALCGRLQTGSSL